MVFTMESEEKHQIRTKLTEIGGKLEIKALDGEENRIDEIGKDPQKSDPWNYSGHPIDVALRLCTVSVIEIMNI